MGIGIAKGASNLPDGVSNQKLPKFTSDMAVNDVVKLSRMILRLWWVFGLLFLADVLRILVLIFPSIPFAVFSINNMVETLAFIFSLGFLYQLICRARISCNFHHRTWAGDSIHIFLTALLLHLLFSLLRDVSYYLVVFNRSPIELLSKIPYTIIDIVVVIGFILSARGIMLLARDVDSKTNAYANHRRYRIILWVWWITLVLCIAGDSYRLILVGEYWAGWVSGIEIAAMMRSSVVAHFLFNIPIIWSLILLVPIWRRLLRIARGIFCPRCGYDLRGKLESGCSECGWERDIDIHDTE